MSAEKQHFFDKPENVKKILYALYASCALLVVLDFVIHRHVYHSWESLWGFYPLYGFVGCVLLVLVAKWMRVFLMRDEHYYDPPEKNDPPEKSRSDTAGSLNQNEKVTIEGAEHERH